jgi:Tripartite tricarboxylate transporter TctB family
MSEHAGGVSARADLFAGVAWTAFGLAIVAGSLTMDRLEQFGATWYTAPGLVPGVLGATIAVLGLLLAIRAMKAGAAAGLVEPWMPTAEGRSALKRASLATLLSLVYTLGLIGRVPFPIASALFVFAFIMVFDVSPDAPSRMPRRATIAAITAIVTSVVVTLVFERIFLVRLP